MIDSLIAMRPRIEATDAPAAHGLERGGYLVVTLHRPALVDGPLLAEAMARLADVSEELPVVFPVHPRTRNAMEAMGLAPTSKRLRLLDPLGYFEFLSLVEGSAGVLTDSGGIQEETTYLGLPCFTLRTNTERPITVELGTNVLLGLEPAADQRGARAAGHGAEERGGGAAAVGRQGVRANRERPGAPFPRGTGSRAGALAGRLFGGRLDQLAGSVQVGLGHENLCPAGWQCRSLAASCGALHRLNAFGLQQADDHLGFPERRHHSNPHA